MVGGGFIAVFTSLLIGIKKGKITLMILATHAVIGAGLAQATTHNLAIAFIIGFVSHFLIDMIPHWHYSLISANRDEQKNIKDMPLGRAFIWDLLKIGIDCLIGFALVVLLFYFLLNLSGKSEVTILLPTLLFGAFGGVSPDALQFIYFKIKKEPLVSLQKFHLFIHAKKDLDNKLFIGIGSQILFVIVFVFLILM